MRSTLVYDAPQRLFHAIFAFLFVGAFVIAKTVDDDSLLYVLHKMAGLLLAFAVCLRLVWGVVGSRYSKFSSFEFNPCALLSYFKGVATGDERRWVGHNPASSWLSLLLFGTALGLAGTGILMSTGQKGAFDLEEIHELLANAFVALALAHVAGLLLHTFRHRDSIALSMLDGAKDASPPSEGIASSRPMVGIVFLACVVAFAAFLRFRYDVVRGTLALPWVTLQLGEEEKGGGKETAGEKGEEEDD
jgi:cytochrome b